MSNDTLPEAMSTDQQRRLLEKLLQQQSEEFAEFPASFAQKRWWLIDQIEPGKATYNIIAACRLRGPLNVECLVQSLNVLIERHETLRTTFANRDGQPVQQIKDAWQIEVPTIDLPDSRDENDPKIQSLIQQFSELPFDLQTGPLFRVQLLRLGAGQHIVLFAAHHIISDGWSMGILMRDFATAYDAISQGAEADFQELEIQFADYATWQNDSLQTASDNAQLNFWKEHLRDAPTLELPTDRPRGFRPTQGASYEFTVPSQLWQSFKNLCSRSAATPFMGLLATLQLLLSRLSGQDDVVVGTPVAGRNRQELENLVGCFLNTLAIRGQIVPQSSFRELLKKTRDLALAGFSNQDIPFERLLEEIPIDRDTQRTPFFQVMLNLLSYEAPNLSLPQLEIELLELPEPAAKFEMTWYAEPVADALVLRLVYDAALFERTRIEIIVDQFVDLLRQAADDPDCSLAAMSLNSPFSQRVVADPRSRLDKPQLPSVADTFRRIAKENADAVALTHRSESWTYQQLSDHAESLAVRIAEATVAGQVVAVTGEKSINLIASMLAVQLASRVLMCIDPNLPDARQALMLDQANAAMLIRSEQFNEFELRALTDHKATQLHKPEAAYVFFTSGSTGQPKAILGSGEGLSHFLEWQRSTFAIGPGDRIAQLTALSFDVVLRDVFLPLTSGATLCLPDSSDAVLSPAILSWLKAAGITACHSVPSLVRSWLASPADGSQPNTSLRYFFSAGEPLSSELCRKITRRFISTTVVNLYGPTETTLAKFSKQINNDPMPGIQPVGNPLPNTQVIILDGDRQCGVGELGEIVIRTPFRSLGYLNKEAVSNNSFFVNPWNNDSADWLYRSGDRGRIAPNGELEILGRMDDQIKIRGVRIEPAEITAAISTCSGVNQCYVTSFVDDDGEKQLVAYLAVDDISDAAFADLRSRIVSDLSTRLSSAMIPTAFCPLLSLPLLPNGKIDRRGLPSVSDFVKPIASETFVAPVGEIEVMLADIWSNVLRLEKVGRHDNFFAIGGHSLLAAQLVARIESRLGIALPLRALFEQPTIERLALRIAENESETAIALPAIEARNPNQAAPLALSQEALWFLDRLDPSGGAYTTYPILSVRGPLDIAVLRKSLATVIDRHEVLRTTFPELHGEPVQNIAPESAVELSITDFSHLENQKRKLAIDEWVQQQVSIGIDLQNGPIVRMQLAKISRDEHVIVVAWHHIIHDGWSLALLAREVTQCYKSLVSHEPPNLPRLDVQYADWAIWQRKLLSGSNLERLSQYWKGQLDQVPSLDLVTDYPRPKIRTTRGNQLHCELSQSQSNAVVSFAQAHGVTPFMVLLSAFRIALGRFSGQSDFAIGSPVANRRKSETENLIGYFINMLVLRTDLAGLKTFAEVVEQTKITVLEAFEHQDLTLDQVVSAVNPPRDTSRHPLFQAMFVLHNNTIPAADIPGFSIEPWNDAPVHSSYFDINLVLQQFGESFVGRLVFNSDLFNQTTIERLWSVMTEVLRIGLAAANDSMLSTPILDGNSREMIHQFATSNPNLLPNDLVAGTLHDRFGQQASQTPIKVALIDGKLEWTYEQLDHLSNQFARELQLQGVTPKSLVGLHLERSASLIVAILGILKTGAGYLPLDEKAPASRNASALEDSQTKFCVTSRKNFGELNDAVENSGVKFVLADDIATIQSTDSIQSFEPPQVSSQQTAYVIYTSGSTGRPKGVVISHAAAVAYIVAAGNEYAITASDRVLQFASISFDAHIEEVFITLLSGGTLVLRSDAMMNSIHDFVKGCAERSISVLSLSTGFWHEIVYAANQKRIELPTSLRLIVIGGEAALTERVSQWFGTYGDSIRLINSYGPTEATVVATTLDLNASSKDLERLPIGRPLANTMAYVLDSHFQFVPIGVRGELFLGGQSLADGYLNQPYLTAERFVELPLDGPDHPTKRLYRTGDIVRWNANGQLEFFGRLDHQIKIRGFRVELTEIENALRSHPSVLDCIVIAATPRDDEMQLASYVVAKEGSDFSISKLREHLQSALPAYMIPSVFVELPALPKTISGKFDRKALPAIDWTSSALIESDPNTFVQPLDGLEADIASQFAVVLGRDRISAIDDFFMIGGNSLLALRLISRFRENLQIDLPMVKLFTLNTVRAIAAYCADTNFDDELPPPPALQVFRDGDTSPAAYNQQRLWLRHHLHSNPAALNMATAMKIVGRFDATLLQRALHEVVSRHESLRTTFRDTENGLLQVVHSKIDVPIKLADFTSLSNDLAVIDAAEFCAAQADEPFNLELGPLLRIAVARLSPDEHVIALVVHHVVFDGPSMQLLRREIVATYSALIQGQVGVRTEPEYQYRDFSIWQRQYLQGPARQKLVKFWSDYLADDEPTRLPKLSTTQSQNNSDYRRYFAVSIATFEKLQKFCKREGVTSFVVLLAVYNLLVHGYTGQRQQTVIAPMSSRGRKELDTMIGYLVNMVFLRNKIDDAQSFGEFVRTVRKSTVRAVEHQDLPLELIVSELKPKRVPGKPPFAQVLINLVQTDAEPSPPTSSLVKVLPFDFSRKSAGSEFELKLEMVESQNGLHGFLAHDQSSMSKEQVDEMSNKYLQLLDVLIDNPTDTVSQSLSKLQFPSTLIEQTASVDYSTATRLSVEEHSVVDEILAWSSDKLQLSELNESDDLYSIGFDSLGLLRLMRHLNEKYFVELPINSVAVGVTPSSLAVDVLRANRKLGRKSLIRNPQSLAAYLIDLRPGTSAEPIFCLHGLGGHVVNFIPLARELLSEQPIVAVQGLGVDGKYEPHDDLNEMADIYTAAILQRQPRGPFTLLGWSMGGLLAMEIGRRLIAAGHLVRPLILLDTHLNLKDRSLEEITEESIIKQIAPRLGIQMRELKSMPLEQQWNWILQQSQALDGDKSDDGGAAEIRKLATVCKSHLRAIATYQSEFYPGNIVMLKAARPWRLLDSRWKRLCENLVAKTVPGSHYSMLAKPDVVELSALIERILHAKSGT